MTKEIKCPRLELRWEQVDGSWFKSICYYNLVIPLDELDIRSNVGDKIGVKKELAINIGKTERESFVDQPPILSNGVVETPFRDGAHSQMDRDKINKDLPIYAICGDHFNLIYRCDNE